MEEQVTYTTVVFEAKSGDSTLEQPNELEIIYDEVKTEAPTAYITPENVKKAPLCSVLHLVAAGLGIICAILVLVIILLHIQFDTIMSEQLSKNRNLTEQIEQLRTEKKNLQNQTQELSRDRDALNWTIGVVLQHENFPVEKYCTPTGCRPCQENWKLFQSHCYFFTEHDYSYHWATWEGSQHACDQLNADLVVIDSLDEQVFISNHTKFYKDYKHGYWIGLHEKEWTETWMWVDGSNVTLEYWKDQPANSRETCALTLPQTNLRANWQKTSCTMKNRYICESRAFFKQEGESAALSSQTYKSLF